MDDTKYLMTLEVAQRGGTFVFSLPLKFCLKRKIKKGDWFKVEFIKLNKA